MAEGNRLEELRSALSLIYEKLDTETITEPECIELEERAGVIQDEIDAILNVIGAEVQKALRERPRPASPPSSERLF
ncbi:hypothetical protein AB0L82_43195 [Nocardia sp. NPDC052001]|uniref:hypothetical protein n=1 Tax=Nocardia sp. NPDC052001 TaxID=3154853 RepID=UPI0034301DA2